MVVFEKYLEAYLEIFDIHRFPTVHLAVKTVFIIHLYFQIFSHRPPL